MKLIKTLLLASSLTLFTASCGGSDDNWARNPFDPSAEISEEVAINQVAAWESVLDKTIYYLAHYEIKNEEPFRRYQYRADYVGHPGDEFEYVSGSIDTEFSTIGDTDDYFHNFVDVGMGFRYVDDEKSDANYKTQYYLNNGQMSVFTSYSEGEIYGYMAVTFNDKGLVSFLEWYEADAEYSGIETQTASFEVVH